MHTGVEHIEKEYNNRSHTSTIRQKMIYAQALLAQHPVNLVVLFTFRA